MATINKEIMIHVHAQRNMLNWPKHGPQNSRKTFTRGNVVMVKIYANRSKTNRPTYA